MKKTTCFRLAFFALLLAFSFQLTYSSAAPVAAPSTVAQTATVAKTTAAEGLKTLVAEAVTSRSHIVEGELKTIAALLAAAAPALSTGDPAAETAYSKAFFKKMNELYVRVVHEVTPKIPVPLEVNAAEEFYADGFFMPTDNPADLVASFSEKLSRLAGNSSASGLKLRVCVLNEPGFMAFAKGGQVIVLTAGFNDIPAGELTAALAHEMAHLERRHFLMYRIVAEVNKILAAKLSADPKLAATALGFANLRFQRQLEYEADSLALRHLKATGFAPENLERLLSRLLGESKPPRLGDDHPTLDARLKAIKRHTSK